MSKSVIVISTAGRNPFFCSDFSVAEFTPLKAGLLRNDKYGL